MVQAQAAKQGLQQLVMTLVVAQQVIHLDQSVVDASHNHCPMETGSQKSHWRGDPLDLTFSKNCVGSIELAFLTKKLLPEIIQRLGPKQKR